MTIIIDKNTSKKEFEKKLHFFQYKKKAKYYNEKKGIDLFKYVGTFKLKKHPLLIQNEMRDEWK